MPDRSSWARVSALSALLCALIACVVPPRRVLGTEPAPPSDCQARIILGLQTPASPPPDDSWVRDVAAASGVQLHYLRAITPRLYLFRMTAPSATGGCTAAIERLGADPRLRSAQIDQRRKHESG